MDVLDFLYYAIENFLITMGILTLFGLVLVIFILHSRIKQDLHENDESEK